MQNEKLTHEEWTKLVASNRLSDDEFVEVTRRMSYQSLIELALDGLPENEMRVGVAWARPDVETGPVICIGAAISREHMEIMHEHHKARGAAVGHLTTENVRHSGSGCDIAELRFVLSSATPTEIVLGCGVADVALGVNLDEIGPELVDLIRSGPRDGVELDPEEVGLMLMRRAAEGHWNPGVRPDARVITATAVCLVSAIETSLVGHVDWHPGAGRPHPMRVLQSGAAMMMISAVSGVPEGGFDHPAAAVRHMMRPGVKSFVESWVAGATSIEGSRKESGPALDSLETAYVSDPFKHQAITSLMHSRTVAVHDLSGPDAYQKLTQIDLVNAATGRTFAGQG